jgi:steroid 5-alpha reductase family enzyme
MAALMSSTTMADIVIVVMIVEGLALYAFRSRLRSVGFVDIAGMLGAGLFLVLALRATLTGAGWPWVALCLSAAFAVHLFDMWRRLSRRWI